MTAYIYGYIPHDEGRTIDTDARRSVEQGNPRARTRPAGALIARRVGEELPLRAQRISRRDAESKMGAAADDDARFAARFA